MPRNKNVNFGPNSMVSCCNKCGRTFQATRNKMELAQKRTDMLLRLHKRKCEGELNLDDNTISVICNREQRLSNASNSFAFNLDQLIRQTSEGENITYQVRDNTPLNSFISSNKLAYILKAIDSQKI